MTTTDRVEFLLRRAVAVNPSDEGLRRLDERVARIMSGAVSTQPRARATRVRFLRPLALAAALLLAAGAVGASLGLLDQAIDQSALPGWRVAWDRAEVIGQRQTDAGVTVTLERAYADVNQVLVGFTVEGLESPTLASGMKDSLAWTADLRDPAGRTAEQWATSSHAQGRDVTGLSAVIHAAASALLWIKWLGVIYLLYLAVITWRQPASDLTGVQPDARPKVFRHGLLLAIVNPKVLLFNAAYLPQFVSGTGNATAEVLLVAAVYLAVLVFGDMLWAVFATAARRGLAHFGHLRNRLTAVFLFGASVGLALSKRSS